MYEKQENELLTPEQVESIPLNHAIWQPLLNHCQWPGEVEDFMYEYNKNYATDINKFLEYPIRLANEYFNIYANQHKHKWKEQRKQNWLSIYGMLIMARAGRAP